jgi:hypothetical protein
MGLAGPRKVLGLAKGFKFRTSNFVRLDSALIPSLLALSPCNTRSVASSSSFGAFRYCVLSVPLVVCAFFPSLDAAPFLFSPPPCNDTKYCARLFCPFFSVLYVFERNAVGFCTLETDAAELTIL